MSLLHRILASRFCFFFFLNAPATTETYTLSLHDALPISTIQTGTVAVLAGGHDRIYPPEHVDLLAALLAHGGAISEMPLGQDRKSTRLNSSHLGISYAVFCLKKKKKIKKYS